MVDQADTERKLAYLARELRVLSAMPVGTQEEVQAAEQTAMRLGRWMKRELPDVSDEDYHFLWHYIIDVDIRRKDPVCAEAQNDGVAKVLTELDSRSRGATGPTRMQKNLMELGQELRVLAELPLSTEEEADTWSSAAEKVEEWISERELGEVLPHELWHYLSDADTRLIDEWYRTQQNTWLQELLEALDRGDVLEDESSAISCAAVALGLAAVLIVGWYVLF